MQRAQNAMEVKNFELALNYYNIVKEKYPDDMEKFVWASYKIAFIYHKMKDDEKALILFNELLELYETDIDNSYPQNPKILALNVMSNIEQAGAGDNQE